MKKVFEQKQVKIFSVSIRAKRSRKVSTSRVTQAVLSTGGEMKEDLFQMMMGLSQDRRAYTATKIEESSVCLFVCFDRHRSSSVNHVQCVSV